MLGPLGGVVINGVSLVRDFQHMIKGVIYHLTVCDHPFETGGQFCGLKQIPLFGSREPGKFICLLWPDPWGWKPSLLAGRRCISISDRFLAGLPGPWWLFPHCWFWARILQASGCCGLTVMAAVPKGSLWVFSPSIFSFQKWTPLPTPIEYNPTFAAKRRLPTDPPAHDQPCTSDGTSVSSGKVCWFWVNAA